MRFIICLGSAKKRRGEGVLELGYMAHMLRARRGLFAALSKLRPQLLRTCAGQARYLNNDLIL